MAGVDGPGPDTWIGSELTGRDGLIGRVVDVYLDEASGRPEWLAVSTGGRAGGQIAFVPVGQAAPRGDGLAVPYGTEEVLAAPRPATEGALTLDEEDALYRHYDVAEPPPPPAGPSGPGSAEDVLIRSEEELHVSKTSSEVGRVRLRKWVETDHVVETVPVAREEVRIERQPINAANVDQALTGARISEAEYEIPVHEEQVTAAKVVVPKEQVRLEKDVVVEEQEVGADLRKERIEVERDGLA